MVNTLRDPSTIHCCAHCYAHPSIHPSIHPFILAELKEISTAQVAHEASIRAKEFMSCSRSVGVVPQIQTGPEVEWDKGWPF